MEQKSLNKRVVAKEINHKPWSYWRCLPDTDDLFIYRNLPPHNRSSSLTNVNVPNHFRGIRTKTDLKTHRSGKTLDSRKSYDRTEVFWRRRRIFLQ